MVKQTKSTKKNEIDIDTKAAAQALKVLLASGYVDKKKLYIENFVRGIFFSLGSVLGATVVVALLLWILSVFNTAPIIGHYIQSIQDSISTR